MHVNNVPTNVGPGEDGFPAFTYESLMEAAIGWDGSVAKALYEANKNVPWQEALMVTKLAADDTDATAAHCKILLGSYADSVTPRYFLIVTGGKIQVLYGLRACRPLDAEGRRYAGLIGDRTFFGGLATHPKLFCTELGQEKSSVPVPLLCLGRSCCLGFQDH